METHGGDPLPIRAYWMTGQRTGREFIYPKEQATRLAKNSTEPVLTTQAPTTRTEETHTSALARVSASGAGTNVVANAKPKAMVPKGPSQHGELAPASITVASAPIPRKATQVARATLPTTASDLPGVALAGVVLLAAGGLVHLRRTARG